MISALLLDARYDGELGHSDMHIHVLGAAPFGHLLAFHLRRHAQHKITLFLGKAALGDSKRQTPATLKLSVETEDGIYSQEGFACEPWDPEANALHAIVFDSKGRFRSKTATTKARRSFDLPISSTLDEHIKSLIITSRPPQVLSAVRHLQNRLDSSSTLVLLQEGLGVYDDLIRDVFRNPDRRPHFILGHSSHAVWKRDPFHVVQQRIGGLKFGIIPDADERLYERSQDVSIPYDQRTLRLDDIYAGEGDNPRYRSLRDTVGALLEVSDVNTRWVPIAVMQRRLLRQCVVQSCVQPLAALNGCRIGALPKLVPALRIMKSVCREAAAVFAAQALAENPDESQGLPHALGLNARLLYDEVLRYCERYRGARPQMSFHFDGRIVTDVEYLNGYLQNLGRKFNIATPATSLLYEMVKLRHRVLLSDGQADNLTAFPYLGQDGSEP